MCLCGFGTTSFTKSYGIRWIRIIYNINCTNITCTCPCVTTVTTETLTIYSCNVQCKTRSSKSIRTTSNSSCTSKSTNIVEWNTSITGKSKGIYTAVSRNDIITDTEGKDFISKGRCLSRISITSFTTEASSLLLTSRTIESYIRDSNRLLFSSSILFFVTRTCENRSNLSNTATTNRTNGT